MPIINKSVIFWSRLRKVSYQKEQPYINFYHFAKVFENEFDCDLVELSKTWTHEYAYDLEHAFSTKTLSWKYEKEWRAVLINFKNYKEPEERIKHYPIEALSAIYFGANTPENVKNRIYKIFMNKNSSISFFNSELTGTDEIEFNKWHYSQS